MRKEMKITAVVLTYNRPRALEAILKSLSGQLLLPDEVIIADDGSGTETAELVKKYEGILPFPLKHVWQEDQGYRIAAIRNKAVRESSGDYLIFSDGDLLFHPLFFRDFRRYFKPGTAGIGSRVFLKKEASNKFEDILLPEVKIPFLSQDIEKNRLNAIRVPFISGLSPLLSYRPNLRGGLLGVWAEDLRSVNGWNEHFTGWGFEDSELLVRLHNHGVKFRKIKFAGIVYHLWHESSGREQMSGNRLLLQNTINCRLAWCTEGLVKDEKS